jgi:hypothetical protein
VGGLSRFASLSSAAARWVLAQYLHAIRFSLVSAFVSRFQIDFLAPSMARHHGRHDLKQPSKQQIERIQRLPRAKQRFVIEMLDTVLAQTSR